MGLVSFFAFAARSPKVKETITFVNLGDYDDVELGSGTFRQRKLIDNELEAKEFSVMLYPKKGVAGFLYKKGFVKERLLLDKDARDMIIKSYEQYLEDYKEKKLDRKQKKYKANYYYARAKIEWGPFQYSTYADPKISTGYVFVGKSPYFCVKIPGTKSTQNKGDTPVEYSGNLLYFTRAQAADFINAIQESEIQKAIESQILEAPPEDDYDGDYEEADSPEEDNEDQWDYIED